MNRSRRLFALCVALSMLTVRLVSAQDDDLTPEELAAVKVAEDQRIQAIKKVYGAVVAVYGNKRQGGGSGVIFDESGLALTNHHVVAAAGTEGWGGLADGKLYRWKLIGTDPGGDVAIIQMEGKDAWPAAPLGDSDRVQVGDFCMAMGNPFTLAEDQNPTVTLGIVSGVRRYQPAGGYNLLVYGNCIQVDSSINPGNSGGPLFNMAGEVIGINGRGSFKERGRVNVGLGYAISSNQIKNFIPELLATKVAQHGTLDAQFGQRKAGVLCETINLDSRVAQLGLKLGDKLLEFEGYPITNANAFTSIISTLPTDWPTHLVYERDGQRKEIWVRLYSLQYQIHKDPQPQGEPRPQPDGDQNDSPRDGDPFKAKPKTDPPKIETQRQGFSIKSQGTIRHDTINRKYCELVLDRWKSFTLRQPADKIQGVGLRVTDDIFRNGEKVGQQHIVLAFDGRFRITAEVGGAQYGCGFDGKHYWSTGKDGIPSKLETSKALLDPYIVQVASLATLFDEKPLDRFGRVLLEGSDKSQEQVAFRLKTVDDEGDWFYVWLSVLDDAQRNQQVRLLKAGPDVDSDGSTGSVTYADWFMIDGVAWPKRRHLVRGLSEKVEDQFIAVRVETLPKIDDQHFLIPSAPIENE